jgi:hypothetical protein
MIIDLETDLDSKRCTRVVVGLPAGYDLSVLFDALTVDYFTGEAITHENFDDDTVIKIEDVGYARRKSLLNFGFRYLTCESLYNPISLKNLT